MKSTPTRLSAVAAVAAAGLLLTSCAGSGSSAAPAESGSPNYELTAATPAPAGTIDSFSWSLSTEPFSLNPAYAFDYADNMVLSNLCESLLVWNADLSTSPGLAEEVTNPEPTKWVYKIREGVKFHDGTELTAADVVASLSFHLDPAIGSYWQSTYEHVESIEQTGDFEVTVTLTKPEPLFNEMMATTAGAISAASALEAGTDYGNGSTGVNCTGPFAFDSWASGETITLKKFADYWNEDGAANAEQIEFVVMNDSNARTSAYQTGEIDGGWGVPTASIQALESAGTGDVFFGINTTIDSLVISNQEGPLGDERVRQALSMAINRDALINAAVKGYAAPATTLTTKSVWVNADEATVDAAFAENTYASYDVEAAKELVKEAGAEGAELVMATMSAAPSFKVIAQAVVSAGAEIGLNITINELPANSYTMLFADPAAREGIDMFSTLWYLSSADPLEMYSILRTGQFSNYGDWSNAEFDELTDAALQETDLAKQLDLAVQIQELTNEQLPWIPLYESPTNVWMGERITGVEPSINYLYAPWAAKIGATS